MDTRCGTISGVPIVGYCRVKDTDIFLPMIETDTDIQWVEGCITPMKMSLLLSPSRKRTLRGCGRKNRAAQSRQAAGVF